MDAYRGPSPRRQRQRFLDQAKRVLVLAAGLVGIWLLLRSQELPLFARAAGPVDLSGHLRDAQGQPVRGASVTVRVPGTQAPLASTESQGDGSFVLDLPEQSLPSELGVEIQRPHFQPWQTALQPDVLASLRAGESVRLPDVELTRCITPGFWVASVSFLAVLAIIATERLHNTMAALLGVAVVLGTSYVGGAITPSLFIFDFESALAYVNFDVIFLVMGMMIVVGVIEETGVFQWLAYQAYRLSRGRTWLLLIILMATTALSSALLDNVTTMLLMAPMTIQIALAIGVSPISLLLAEVMASNVGGISTLIGTPTNILIGSHAQLTFNDFLRNLTPGVLTAMATLIGYTVFYYRHQLFARSGGLSSSLLERLQESGRITQPQKLAKAGVVFAVMLVLFVIGERIHLVPAVTAIVGAVAMLLWVAPDIEEMLKVVDWTTLVFFIALFIVVGAIQEVGLISIVANGIARLVGGNLVAAILVTVWISALISAVIANIPFTAAMLPVVAYLTRTVPGASSQVLYYGLSIGSGMGGNASLIGASANMVTAGIADRAGYRISYLDFIKVGLPAMILTVAVGVAWLFIRF
jgi:Na+/H+ antiporter NhaD/arsenite permease-like protein